MKKIFRHLIRVLLILILLFCVMLYALLFTQSGLNTALYFTKKIFPHVKIASSQGALASQITLQNLSYSNELIDIEIKNLVVMWQPFQLLSHQLFIQQLFMQGVN